MFIRPPQAGKIFLPFLIYKGNKIYRGKWGESMQIGMDVSLGQSQQLILTPQMEQALHILQMGAEELNQCIEEEILSNPMLEYGKKRGDFSKYQSYAQVLADEKSRGPGLKEYLRMQLLTKGLAPRDENIADYFIECIEESGYFKINVGDITKKLGISKEKGEKIIVFLQGFDPPGVFARDLKECLLLQLTGKDENTIRARLLVEEHLLDIARNKIPKISRETGLSMKETAEGIEYIKNKLEPVPGQGYGYGQERNLFLYPDVTVKKQGENYRIFLNREKIPDLRLSRENLPLLTEYEGKEESGYLKEQYNRAKMFIKNLGKREETLFAVTEALVEWQEEFFEKGRGYLRPMNLIDIAQAVNLHESTVSRAVKDKYLECRWGVFDMKYFFSYKGPQGTAGNVKRKIQEIIAGEDKKKPLSDAGIAKILTEQGDCISRRTVAKYREQLQIPNTQVRKSFL